MQSQKNNYLHCMFILFIMLVGLGCIAVLAFTPGENDVFEIAVFCIYCAAILIVIVKLCTFEKTVYGTEEITFYRWWRKKGSLAWKDITEIRDVNMSASQSALNNISPTFCAAYTDKHTVTPIIGKFGNAYNKSSQGKRLKLNCDSSPLAWAFCTVTADSDTFLQHLKYRRPDLIKSKSKKSNCIGYD